MPERTCLADEACGRKIDARDRFEHLETAHQARPGIRLNELREPGLPLCEGVGLVLKAAYRDARHAVSW